jgi:hypothetical protein
MAKKKETVDNSGYFGEYLEDDSENAMPPLEVDIYANIDIYRNIDLSQDISLGNIEKRSRAFDPRNQSEDLYIHNVRDLTENLYEQANESSLSHISQDLSRSFQDAVETTRSNSDVYRDIYLASEHISPHIYKYNDIEDGDDIYKDIDDISDRPPDHHHLQRIASEDYDFYSPSSDSSRSMSSPVHATEGEAKATASHPLVWKLVECDSLEDSLDNLVKEISSPSQLNPTSPVAPYSPHSPFAAALGSAGISSFTLVEPFSRGSEEAKAEKCEQKMDEEAEEGSTASYSDDFESLSSKASSILPRGPTKIGDVAKGTYLKPYQPIATKPTPDEISKRNALAIKDRDHSNHNESESDGEGYSDDSFQGGDDDYDPDEESISRLADANASYLSGKTPHLQ